MSTRPDANKIEEVNELYGNFLDTPLSAHGAALCLDIIGTVNALYPSIDLWDQFNEAGIINGHDMQSCRLVPSWVQAKRSSHPLVVGLWLCAVHTQSKVEKSPKKDMILDDLRRVLLAMRDLESHCNRHSRVLNPTTTMLNSEANRLMDTDKCGPVVTVELSRRIGSAVKKIDDIKACVAGFASEAVAKAPDLNARQVKAIWKSLERPIEMLEKRFQNQLVRKDAVPVLFWPNASGHAILEMAWLVFIRAKTKCDATTLARCGLVLPDGSWWLVIIVWVRHILKHGTVDVMTGLAIVGDGDNTFCGGVTWCAHLVHGKPFFQAIANESPATVTLAELLSINATVQLRSTNFLIKSRCANALSSIVKHSTTAATTIMARLGGAGLITPIDEVTTAAFWTFQINCGSIREEWISDDGGL